MAGMGAQRNGRNWPLADGPLFWRGAFKQKFVQLIGWSKIPLRGEIGGAERKIGASSATLVAYLPNNYPIAWDNLTCALHCPPLSTPVESPETANFFLWHAS